jgi:hypothetical protein
MSQPRSLEVSTNVVPTWFTGPLKSEYSDLGSQSCHRDVSHRNAQTCSTGASTRPSYRMWSGAAG